MRIAANHTVGRCGHGGLDEFVVGGIVCNDRHFLVWSDKLSFSLYPVKDWCNRIGSKPQLWPQKNIRIFRNDRLADDEYKLFCFPVVVECAEPSTQQHRDEDVGVKHHAHGLPSRREPHRQYLVR